MKKSKNTVCRYKGLRARFTSWMWRFSLICLSLAVTSCQKEEVFTYDVSRTGLSIWVGTSAGAVYEDVSYNYSYAYEKGSVTFYARINGLPADYDRTFRLEAYGDDLELVAPTICDEEYVLPAGQVFGEYKVVFNSQHLASPELFSEHDGSISFRVVQNETFMLGAEHMQSFTVNLRNRLAKPDNWDTANYPRVPLSKYFGTYSRVKYQFMIEVLGMIDFEISYMASTAYDEAKNMVSPSYAVYLQQLMQERLTEYNAAHEEPLTDENGEKVTF